MEGRVRWVTENGQLLERVELVVLCLTRKAEMVLSKILLFYIFKFLLCQVLF